VAHAERSARHNNPGARSTVSWERRTGRNWPPSDRAGVQHTCAEQTCGHRMRDGPRGAAESPPPCLKSGGASCLRAVSQLSTAADLGRTLEFSSDPRLDELLAGQGFLSCSDGVDHVGPSTPTPARRRPASPTPPRTGRRAAPGAANAPACWPPPAGSPGPVARCTGRVPSISGPAAVPTPPFTVSRPRPQMAILSRRADDEHEGHSRGEGETCGSAVWRSWDMGPVGP
jgi:hypothetical protein